MKTYKFECYDEEDKTLTTVSYTTDCETWSGYDGPMWKFFDFLKGCGFIFNPDTEIGVQHPERGFESASRNWYD